MKLSSLTSRGNGDAHVPDEAYATQHDHRACGDVRGPSYALDDALAHGALDDHHDAFRDA